MGVNTSATLWYWGALAGCIAAVVGAWLAAKEEAAAGA